MTVPGCLPTPFIIYCDETLVSFSDHDLEWFGYNTRNRGVVREVGESCKTLLHQRTVDPSNNTV